MIPDYQAIWWLIPGVLFLAVFVWWESKAACPVLDIKIFRHNRGFTLSNIAALINYATTYAVAFLISLYLQYTKGLTPEIAGIVLIAQPAVQTIFSPSAGRLSDTIEPRIVASSGMALTAASLLIFVFLTPDTSLWWIIVVLVLLGSGLALFSSPNTNAIMSSVDRSHIGVASSMVATMRAVGQLSSMAIAMMTFSLLIGRVQITPDVYPEFLTSVKVVFLILGILSCIGIFASYSRGTLSGEGLQDEVKTGKTGKKT